jgi:hypothetical protein
LRDSWLTVPGASIGQQLPGAEEFQKMIGFVPTPVFIGFYFGHPEGDHPVGGKGDGKAAAVDIHNGVYRKPAGNFLYVPFGKYDEIIICKHRGSISKPVKYYKIVKILNKRVEKKLEFCCYLPFFFAPLLDLIIFIRKY